MIIYETIWLVAVSVLAALLVHEGGHVLGALATGQTPRVLMLGLGPVLVRFHIRALAVVVRALPVTGYVLVEPTDDRWAYAAMVAAGPLANLLALGFALRALNERPASDLALALAVYQGLFAAATLLPMRGKIGEIRMRSDGAQLYALLRGGRIRGLTAMHTAMVAQVEPKGAPPPNPSRHAARLMFALGRADQFVDPWAREEAFASLRGLLDRPDLTRPERALVLCVLCAQRFLYGGGERPVEELDAWSREAMTLTAEPLGEDTRGAVLLAMGRRGEAEALLRRALDAYVRRDGDGGGQTALCRALLARAIDPTGRTEEAQGLWREAESAPAIVADPRLRDILTRIKSRALPAGGRDERPVHASRIG